jgi:histidinol-phosphate aminotransferase
VSAPEPTPLLAAVPQAVPFVAPEELARRVGRASLLRLGANESAFGPSPRALEAMSAALHDVSLYGDPESRELREAIARRHACGIERVVVASGIDELLGLVVRAYLAPGEIAVATRGTYPTFVYHVFGFGARLETMPYGDDGSVPLHDLAVLSRGVDAKLVYLANPDNPSGSLRGRRDVETFLANVNPRAIVILDEAYADFVPAGELVPDPPGAQTVRMRTFSKAFGLAGIRIAYAIADPSVIAALQKIRHHFGVNRVAQAGALAALDDSAFVASVVREVARGRAEYADLGERLGVPTFPSAANFVCFDLGTRERAEWMVEELLRRGIFVRKPGAAPIDRAIRVTVGTAAQRAAFAHAFTEALAAAEAKT